MRLAFSLPLLLATTAGAGEESRRLVIPDELFLKLATGAAPGSCADAESEARARAQSRVAFADEVDLVGHIERIEDGALVVLGRRVDPELAKLGGGGRDSLRRGELVRVVGAGLPDGSVRARLLEVQPARDPDLLARLEREIAKFEKKYWKKAKRHVDPDLERYLQGIVDRLSPAYAPAADRRFHVVVVQDPELNAFALPDGQIVLHSGIIARLDNEAQLASVLGHEMAHVSQRHALRALGKETEHQIVGWGSLLAALALGLGGKGDAAQGVQLMSSAWLSGYSRAHEDEADQVGLRYLYLAGYDVREAPEVWRTFQLLYGDMSREANFFYGSHSTARDREHNLSHEVWKAYEPSGLTGGRVGREEFLRATAALVRDNALLDLEKGHPAWADWGLAKSLAIAPDDPATHVALGRTAVKRGDLTQAVDSFHHAIALDPAHAPAYRELGFTLERLGDAAGARDALERYLELVPEAADSAAVRRAIARI